MAAAIEDNSSGDEVELVYYRGENRRTATVKLGERPDQLQAEEPPGGGGLFPLP